MLLIFLLMSCGESIKTEDKTSGEGGNIEEKEAGLKRYNADQTDYKKDGVILRLASSNKPLSGLVYFNFDNGKLAYEREYKNGLLNGRSISYHENGQKSSEGKFLNDQLHGEVIAWDMNEIVEYIKVYERGSCVMGCD